MEVTLMELLDSREQRVWHQQELLDKYCSFGADMDASGVLVSVTLNIPGPVKDRPEYRKIMEWGMEQLNYKFDDDVAYCETRFLKTGAEGYLCLSGIDALEAKRKCVEVENSNPKARLLDIDVLTKEGGISRSRIGLPPRKCLLCDNDAKACARSQKHNMEELLAKIDEICKKE